MTANGWLQIALFGLAVVLVTKPLGRYLVAVYEGRVHWLGAIERGLYRVAGVDPEEDQHWTRYAGATLLFSAVSMLLTYAVLRLQHLLPLNPQGFAAVPDRQAFETAASFTSNTNWQSYAGESTMSYLSQMSQLAFHNFASAAVGMALAVALVRGIARRSAGRLGNFWADLVRGTLYVLLPLSLAVALIMVQQGAIQNFRPYLDVTTLEGAKQTLAMGPVASQEAIKQLGTNGGRRAVPLRPGVHGAASAEAGTGSFAAAAVDHGAGGGVSVAGGVRSTRCHPERSEGGHARYGPLHFVQGDMFV
jgi:K+-transporting ATPase ATPase A chain